MKRTFYIILLAAVLVAAGSVIAVAVAVGDEENIPVIPAEDVSAEDWFFDAIAYMYETGLMNGTSETAFSPYREISIAMPLTILWRMEGCPPSDPQNYDAGYDSWYDGALAWAASAGIIDADRYEDAHSAASREDVASMLYAYAAYKGVDTRAGRTDISAYSDVSHISGYAYEAMEWICGVNLISGIDEGCLSPDSIANRAQLATMLMRFCRNILL